MPVDIGGKNVNKTVGRNKSGCLWKKGTSTKSSRSNVGLNKRTWE